MNYERGRELQARLHHLVPGGSHTYSKGEDQFPRQAPQIIERGEGAYCWDVDGNRFIDWAMGNRVSVLGHAPPAVNEAVKRAIDRGLNFTRPSLLEYELAEYVVDLLPCAEMVKFAKNGSDVTSAAVRLARAYTGRKYIAVAREHPFFSVNDWFIGTTAMHAGVPDEISALTISFPYNDIEAVEQLVTEHPGQIAALMLEPVKNDEPVDGFLEKLRELASREGIVLIFDEMIAGLRFDLRGAHHRYGVYPDIACFGKAVASGYSCSILTGKRELMELGGLHHDRERVFLLSQTHGAESVGLAACRATLEECERNDVSGYIWEVGGKLVRAFRETAAAEGVEDQLRMIGFDCNPQIVCTQPDGTYSPLLQTLLQQELIAETVLMPWTTVTWAHREPEIERTIEALGSAIARTADAIKTGAVEERVDGEPVKPVFRPYNRCRQSACGRLVPSAPKLDCCTEA
ncbi:MAG: glutamate-semialdehyde -aminomutase [Thermoleophilaceae bacterium]|jgi:glutamate-1-semialdehyde 2,1-aminomutase|nr:glutamate-semialdehyde -aminomutase [Thermoleophilaceae bacterium]